MKRTILWFLLPVVLIPLLFYLLLTYRNGEAMRFVKQLGAGINLGNDLDVTGAKAFHEDATVADYETYWGNVPASRELFAAFRAAGFQTVRIPVSFGEHMDAQNIIDAEWLDRVQEVVDWALAEDLYVILDTHHEDWIYPTEALEAETTEKLTALWTQIAERFRDYDERLLFEGMNEPRLRGTTEEWTAGTKEAQGVINRLNAAFVSAVRATGEENETRYLLLGGYATGYRTEALEAIALPDDKHILVAVHAYLPYLFTNAESGNESWEPGNLRYTEEITTLQSDLSRLFLEKKVPVVITEFGCEEKQSEAEREKWAEDYTDAFSSIGVPYLWWDNGKSYALFDRSTAAPTAPELIKILVDKMGKA